MDNLEKKYCNFDINLTYYGELLKGGVIKEDSSIFVFDEGCSKKEERSFLINRDHRYISLSKSRKFKVNPLTKIKEFSTQVLLPSFKYAKRAPLHVKIRDFTSRSFLSGSILRAVKNGNIIDLGGIHCFLPTGSKEIGKIHYQKRNSRDVQLFHVLKLGLMINKESEIFFNVIASRRQAFPQHFKKLLKMFNNQVKKTGEFNTSQKQKIHIKHKNIRVITKIQKNRNLDFLKKIKEVVISYS